MPTDDPIENAWRAQFPASAARLDREVTQHTSETMFDSQDLRDAFGHGYRAAQAVAEQRVTLRAAQARIEALEELIASAAPLTWAAVGDQDDAVAWEKRAEVLLKDGALPSRPEKT